jgi:CP family cyanate transporter-like MFS transporter
MNADTRDAQAPGGASPAVRELWRGRSAVLVGIVLMGISLRYAITGLSPLLTDVRLALGIDTAGATLIGMLPTLSFGAAGFLAPLVARRLGAETTALIAVGLAAVGCLIRPFVDDATGFIALTLVGLVGMGLGNVVGAPLVKRYFPDRQAAMITVFSLLMQAGATLPAMTAVPVANAWGWQVSLASWGLLSLAAVVPWAIQVARIRRAPPDSAAATAASTAPRLGLAAQLANPVSAGTALFYAMASLNIYGMLAWLPTILQQHLGLDRNSAAAAFAVYTFMTLPMAVVTPLLANRMRNPVPLAVALSAVAPVGYLGILFAVGPPWLLTLVAGLAGGAFPLAIAMFNLRTKTPMGSAAIAGFSMGTGYLVGTPGPLLGGWLYGQTGSWTLPLWVYVGTAVPMTIGALMMARPGRYLEGQSA